MQLFFQIFLNKQILFTYFPYLQPYQQYFLSTENILFNWFFDQNIFALVCSTNLYIVNNIKIIAKYWLNQIYLAIDSSPFWKTLHEFLALRIICACKTIFFIWSLLQSKPINFLYLFNNFIFIERCEIILRSCFIIKTLNTINLIKRYFYMRHCILF